MKKFPCSKSIETHMELIDTYLKTMTTFRKGKRWLGWERGALAVSVKFTCLQENLKERRRHKNIYDFLYFPESLKIS